MPFQLSCFNHSDLHFKIHITYKQLVDIMVQFLTDFLVTYGYTFNFILLIE